LSSKIRGKPIFPRIIEDLSNPDRALGVKNGGVRYRFLPLAAERPVGDFSDGAADPEDFIVKAERYGVPQARHRVIIVGIREDLRLPRNFSMTLNGGQHEVPASAVLMGLPPIRSGVSGHKDATSEWIRIVENARKHLVRILQVRDPRVSSYLSTVKFNPLLRRSESLYFDGDQPEIVLQWYRSDSTTKRLFNHETRSHMRQDLGRYLYCAAFSIVHRRSPTSSEFPPVLAPNHQNWATGDFSDRFRVQLPFRPASTVTSHLAKDGHHFIHWDASQCRSMSVREAARLQTFPDDYVFIGGRTSQFTQVGNAVPPLLARQIAQKIANFLKA